MFNIFVRHFQYDYLNVMHILSFYHFKLPLTVLHHFDRNIGRHTQKLLFLTHQVP